VLRCVSVLHGRLDKPAVNATSCMNAGHVAPDINKRRAWRCTVFQTLFSPRRQFWQEEKSSPNLTETFPAHFGNPVVYNSWNLCVSSEIYH